MPELHMMRLGLSLMPFKEEDGDVLAGISKTSVLSVSVKVPVNPAFRAKWMSMVQMVFDMYSERSEGVEYKGVMVKPDFTTFRKDVTILAGFYDAAVHLNGKVTFTAKSLKWDEMEDDEFARLFEATFGVLTEKVLPQFLAGEELERAREAVFEYG